MKMMDKVCTPTYIYYKTHLTPNAHHHSDMMMTMGRATGG
jgi:hypothetical protein